MSEDAAASAVGVGEPPDPITTPQASTFVKQSGGPSGNIDSVDASCTSAVVGAGAPGGETSRTPIPTIAAPGRLLLYIGEPTSAACACDY